MVETPKSGRKPLTQEDYRKYIEQKYPGLIDSFAKKKNREEIAQFFNVKKDALRYIQKKLGFRTKKSKYTKEKFREETEKRYPGMVAKMGVISDAQIAKEYKITRAYVGYQRKRCGIQACPTPAKKIVAVPAEEKKDTSLKQKIERNRILLDGIEHRLGVETDASLAREIGVSVRVVYDRRTRLGIQTNFPSPRSKHWVGKKKNDAE